MAHHHHHPHEPSPTRALALVLVLTSAYALAEVIGGWLSNSLALIADAGHMLADIAALAIALFAAWAARRPADGSRTYGYQRAEILAALFNGVALILIALGVALEAWRRMQAPPPVAWGLMSVVAAGGLAVNVIAARVLHGCQHTLNVRAAYLHVLGDLLGSIGALAAAGLIAWRGWLWADPLASAAIGAIIVVGAIRLVLNAVNVLMEAAPAHIDCAQVRSALVELAGVAEVHELHVWSLGGQEALLSAHLVLDHSRPAAEVLRSATELLLTRFAIAHATLQVEPPDFNIRLSAGCAGGGARSRT